MNPEEAHEIFAETLARSRQGTLEWRLKRESKAEPRCLDFAAPATDSAHGVEIGSEDVEEYGTVYEFRVMDEAGAPLYEYALSNHALNEGDGRTYKGFVELFNLAKHRALARSGKSR